jgi:hypothetical protein
MNSTSEWGYAVDVMGQYAIEKHHHDLPANVVGQEQHGQCTRHLGLHSGYESLVAASGRRHLLRSTAKEVTVAWCWPFNGVEGMKKQRLLVDIMAQRLAADP